MGWSARLLLLLLSTAPMAPAQATQQTIEARLKGHPLYLRGQWKSDQLQFDLAGATSSPRISAPFTLCGIDVKKINLANDRLEIQGDRIGLEFEHDAPKRVPLREKISITIAGGQAADYSAALNKIFADGLPDLVPNMPFYWQNYAQAHFLTLPSAVAASSAPVSPASKPKPQLLKLSPPNSHYPQVLESAEPGVTDAARDLRYSASALIRITVKEDGTTGEPYIARAVGLGLDEQALYAVAHYRFKPATDASGKPIATPLNIEVNFAP